MLKEFEKICVDHSTQNENLENKVSTLKKKPEKLELQSEDQATAELHDTITLGGDILPYVSASESCSVAATEVILTKLKISLVNDVIIAAYRIGKNVTTKSS